MSKWLPIETAPRDGSPIVLWLPHVRLVRTGHWDRNWRANRPGPGWTVHWKSGNEILFRTCPHALDAPTRTSGILRCLSAPMEIKNGSTVHRIWGVLEDADLIAVFQYHDHAKTFCNAILHRQSKGNRIILAAVNHRDGTMDLFHRDEEGSKEEGSKEEGSKEEGSTP
jgi:hypothetical protein